MSLQKNTEEFIKVMSNPASVQEDINSALGKCYNLLQDSNNDELGVFMNKMLSLSELPDRERAPMGAMICGSLIEANFPSKPILEPFINLYESFLDKSRSFFELFFSKINQIEGLTEDNYDEKERELFDSLIEDRNITSEETHMAIVSLNEYYLPAISLFSINKENLMKAKERIGDKVAFIGRYSMGCDWINTLFKVVFDEPILVIDIDKMIGFSGKTNGLVDNYQLQHLLMSLPLLNDGRSTISEEDLLVVNGQGNQNGDGRTLVNKWNMYNLELCKNPNWKEIIGNPAKSIDYRDNWIWSEGITTDITKHNGYRVVLLGKASYNRTTQVQRIFKNLKADIQIEKELSEEEIKNHINLLK